MACQPVSARLRLRPGRLAPAVIRGSHPTRPRIRNSKRLASSPPYSRCPSRQPVKSGTYSPDWGPCLCAALANWAARHSPEAERGACRRRRTAWAPPENPESGGLGSWPPGKSHPVVGIACGAGQDDPATATTPYRTRIRGVGLDRMRAPKETDRACSLPRAGGRASPQSSIVGPVGLECAHPSRTVQRNPIRWHCDRSPIRRGNRPSAQHHSRLVRTRLPALPAPFRRIRSIDAGLLLPSSRTPGWTRTLEV